MIVPKDEIKSYTGNDVGKLEGVLRSITYNKLEEDDDRCRKKFGVSLIDHLFFQHQQKARGIRALSKEQGIGDSTLRRIFALYNLPILTQTEINRKMRELGIGAYGTDSETGERYNVINGRIRGKKALEEGSGIHNQTRERRLELASKGGKNAAITFRQNPSLLEKRGKAIKKSYENPESRKKLKNALERRWKSKQYKERMKQHLKTRWKTDEGYRKKMIDGSRKARLDPSNEGKFYLPTIQGERGDIGYAQSSWEANLIRILIHCGRDFSLRESIQLNVSNKYKHLFESDSTFFNIDFVVGGSGERDLLYEIVAHPFEDPVGIAKVKMLKEQYPALDFRVVDREFYRRLEKRFQPKIDSDPNLLGWETSKDNLKTNPSKYSPN